jgi:hypothetical protein
MIAIYVLFLVIAGIIYALTPNLNSVMRISVATAVFLVPSIVVTVLVVLTGDR